MIILTHEISVAAEAGDSILAAMRRAEKNLQSICGGRGMCGTCRVAVDEEWLPMLAPPSLAETRLLRVLKAGMPNHRLACQIVLEDRHDGLRFEPAPPPTRVLLKETAA